MKAARARPGSGSFPIAAAAALALAAASPAAFATEPCGDFAACKALIEINATDGDIGFHFLMDGDDLRSATIDGPNGARVFEERARGPLEEQKLTETFAESAEPLCWPAPDADPDAEIVTLEEFLARWAAGTYRFSGRGVAAEKSSGETQLSHQLPAAPANLAFDGSAISWEAGSDLGRCASEAELALLVEEEVLPLHPEDVPVAAWEIVLSPDVEEGNPIRSLVFSVRVPGGIDLVTVPPEYLTALPADTLLKIEIGAIAADDNATFSEADGFCVNEVEGCAE